MAEWRLLRGWTDEALAAQLARVRGLGLNFQAEDAEMTREAGWSQVRSRSVLARERPGPPVPGGAYERARGLIEAFDFSDPRIVQWHFRADDPLQGRPVLLELKAPLGLRYLCPARVGGVREERGEARTRYGFSFETLEGHFEVGREWFLLSKDHASGEVRFEIEAAWRPGTFPNWWSELGFLMVGTRSQRAWHRLTHVRLRRLLRQGQVPEAHEGGAGVVHAGHALEREEPVQVFAQPALGRRKTKVEQEEETVQHASAMTQWWGPLGLGVLAGMRSMSAPALVSRRLTGRPLSGALHGASGLLAGTGRARALAVLAAGEMAADKSSRLPARTQPAALVGRALSGALVGAVAGERGGAGGRLRAALLGAGAAVAASFVLAALRRLATERMHVPNALAGLAEDAAVVALGLRLAPLLDAQPQPVPAPA